MAQGAAGADQAHDVKILIVEDEFFLALEMEMCLLDAGYRVVGHGVSRRTALDVAQEDRPDLALVDINLQDGMTGLEVAADLGRRGIACLFVTATCAEDIGRDYAVGCLHKPFDAKDLLAAVEAVERCARGEREVLLPAHMHLFGATRGGGPTSRSAS